MLMNLIRQLKIGPLSKSNTQGMSTLELPPCRYQLHGTRASFVHCGCAVGREVDKCTLKRAQVDIERLIRPICTFILCTNEGLTTITNDFLQQPINVHLYLTKIAFIAF